MMSGNKSKAQGKVMGQDIKKEGIFAQVGLAVMIVFGIGSFGSTPIAGVVLIALGLSISKTARRKIFNIPDYYNGRPFFVLWMIVFAITLGAMAYMHETQQSGADVLTHLYGLFKSKLGIE